MPPVDVAPTATQKGTRLKVPAVPANSGRDSRKSQSPGTLSRLASVDLLRGAAMILMALDHTRDFFTADRFAPEDLHHTSGPLFFMRFITHFSAPVFFVLAGTGAYLSLAQGRSVAQVSKFLWTRGLWLVFLNLTVVSFAWTSIFPFLFSDVLWSLGWSMVAMAFLIRLPVRWIAALGVAIIFTHNLLDRVNPVALGKFSGLWLILHGYGGFWIEPDRIWFFVLWPLIPWLGVMAVGYALGSLMHGKDWPKLIFRIGAASLITFAFLRAFRLYGNSHHHIFGVAAGRWQLEPTLSLTIASFFDTLKYPPSLQFLLMTVGPCLMALAWLATVNPERRLSKIVLVFGRVPLFYYVVHLFVIHMMAVYVAILFKQKAAWLLYGGFMVNRPPDGYGHSLPFVYLMWLLSVLIMYPFCKMFMGLKERHTDWWWLRYL
jgi:uncharacterized membrane protein